MSGNVSSYSVKNWGVSWPGEWLLASW